jgi:hypothetical protein
VERRVIEQFQGPGEVFIIHNLSRAIAGRNRNPFIQYEHLERGQIKQDSMIEYPLTIQLILIFCSRLFAGFFHLRSSAKTNLRMIYRGPIF